MGASAPEAKASKRGKGTRVGYTYLHTAIDGFSRLAYTEALDGREGLHHYRLLLPRPAFTATITSLAPRHQRTRPYTPRHNGKVEHYNHILAKECPYARPYSSQQQRRDAVAVQNHHYNHHRPHTTCHNQPPATHVPAHITNIMTSYT